MNVARFSKMENRILFYPQKTFVKNNFWNIVYINDYVDRCWFHLLPEKIFHRIMVFICIERFVRSINLIIIILFFFLILAHLLPFLCHGPFVFLFFRCIAGRVTIDRDVSHSSNGLSLCNFVKLFFRSK
jgi:hypothetical protein